MALLTNEQIAELIGIASNQSTSKDLHDDFHEWNEKQASQQVAINWNDAPKYATKAVLRLHWVTESLGSELWSAASDLITFDRPAPVITPHPHAEMIAKYAEVAQRRADPWVEFEWTFKILNAYWQNCDRFIEFSVDKYYRHVGETK